MFIVLVGGVGLFWVVINVFGCWWLVVALFGYVVWVLYGLLFMVSVGWCVCVVCVACWWLVFVWFVGLVVVLGFRVGFVVVRVLLLRVDWCLGVLLCNELYLF